MLERKRYFTEGEVRSILKISGGTFLQMVKDGRLRNVPQYGIIRITRESIMELL